MAASRLQCCPKPCGRCGSSASRQLPTSCGHRTGLVRRTRIDSRAREGARLFVGRRIAGSTGKPGELRADGGWPPASTPRGLTWNVQRGTWNASRILNVLVFEELEELLRHGDLRELVGYVGFFRKLGDLAEDRQVLVGDFERGGDDQKEVVHRFAVDGVEIDAGELAPERNPQPVDGQRAAVGNRDIVADPRRAERLAPLQHLHERLLGLLVETEETDQLLQDVVLAAALQLEVDGVFGKKLAQAHVRSPVPERRRNVITGCSSRHGGGTSRYQPLCFQRFSVATMQRGAKPSA